MFEGDQLATTADIVCVGAGHNGLVAAAYLAAAGRKCSYSSETSGSAVES